MYILDGYIEVLRSYFTDKVLYPLRTGEERTLDIVPGGTKLGTHVKTGSRAGRTLSIIPKSSVLEFCCL
jgi:hypothetical protein